MSTCWFVSNRRGSTLRLSTTRRNQMSAHSIDNSTEQLFQDLLLLGTTSKWRVRVDRELCKILLVRRMGVQGKTADTRNANRRHELACVIRYHNPWLLGRWLCYLVDSFRIKYAHLATVNHSTCTKSLLTQSTTRRSNYFRSVVDTRSLKSAIWSTWYALSKRKWTFDMLDWLGWHWNNNCCTCEDK